MLRDGLYTRFPKPQYALAYHSNSEGLAGTVSASEDIQYSSSDSVDIVVPGIGAHGASPHTGKDPVYMASQIVVALQGLISRERAPLVPGVITVGSFHAGTKHNIISDEACTAALCCGYKRVSGYALGSSTRSVVSDQFRHWR